jgi:hypothetical protein
VKGVVVFVHASSYDRGTLLARDVVLLSTVLSLLALGGCRERGERS